MLGLRASQGEIASSLTALGYVLATAIAIVRLCRERLILPRAAYTLFLIGSISAWAVVVSTDDEPARVVVSVRTGKPVAALTPFVRVADAVRERLRPGDRVLFDDVELFPLAALLILPRAFPRRQSSSRWRSSTRGIRRVWWWCPRPEVLGVAIIVELSSGTLDTHYRLIDRAGPLLVYERWARGQ